MSQTKAQLIEGLNINTSAPADALVIDSSGKVGIGTSSPTHTLHLSGSAGTQLKVQTSAASAYINLVNSSASGGYVGYQGDNLTLWTGSTERLRVNSAGNVGIGDSSPGHKLVVKDAGASNTSNYLNVISGNAANAGIAFGDTDAALIAGVLYNHTDNALRFFQNGFTEAARIDSSGRLLVGTTSDVSGGLSTTLIQGVATGGGYVGLARNDTSVGDGNGIGGLRFYANDPSGYNDVGIVQCVADGAHAANDYPTRLEFHTTADGASSPAERMRITNSGRVGIGSTAPGHTLEVKGSFPDIAIVDSDTTNDKFRILHNGGATQLQVDPNNVSSSSHLLVAVDGTERMRIDSSGNVGIGTASPGSKLEVTGGAVTLRNGASSFPDGISAPVIYGSTGGGSGTFNESGNLVLQSRSDAGSYNICMVTGDTPAERMRINSSGNVGIGSTSPGAKLHIANTGGNADLVLQGSASGESIINFGDTADLDVGQILYNHSSNYMRFLTNTGERMRIDSSGNLLVGTTSNARGKLTIFNGTDFSTGTLNNGDNIYLVSDATSGNNVYGASIAFSRVQYPDRKAAAIAAVQTSSDEDHVGLAFFTHPSSNASDAIVEAMRIDNTGRLLVGASATAGSARLVQIAATSSEAGLSATRYVNDAGGAAAIDLAKSRNGTIGSQTIVQSGDALGYLQFRGSDGTNQLAAAHIKTEVDGTPGTNDMPGRLVFSTTADGASSPSERMRITNSGTVGVGNLTPTSATLEVQGQNTYQNSASTLATATTKAAFRVKGSNNSSDSLWMGVETSDAHPYIQGANGIGDNAKEILLNPFGGNVGIGVTVPSALLHISKQVNSGDVGLIIQNTGTSSQTASLYLNKGSGGEPDHRIQNDTGGNLTFARGTDESSYTEQMRLDSSGRLLVGTTSNSGNVRAVFQGNAGGGTGGGDVIFARNASTPSDGQALGLVGFSDSTHTVSAMVQCKREGGTWSSSSKPTMMQLHTCADGTTNMSERIRLTSLGDVRIKDFSPRIGAALSVGSTNFTSYFAATSSGSSNIPMIVERYSDNGTAIEFKRNTAVVGTISVTASNTAFNQSSDYRLKENVVDLDGAITRVKQLAPKRFNFIVEPDATVDGFLAHEAATVVPEAVTGTHNEVDAENNPVYQGIDQSKLVPLLTAALQEAIAKIESLETSNADLLARVTALEG